MTATQQPYSSIVKARREEAQALIDAKKATKREKQHNWDGESSDNNTGSRSSMGSQVSDRKLSPKALIKRYRCMHDAMARHHNLAEPSLPTVRCTRANTAAHGLCCD